MFFRALLIILLVATGNAWADNDYEINFIIKAKHPPVGVVFEVIEGKHADLDWVLLQIQKYTRMIKEKHPNMKFAVVSHGNEQFGLLKENKGKMSGAHQKVQSLVSNDVPVHVCGTHASWYNKDEDDFPDYVDVVDAGPAKVNAYQREGYDLIVLEKPKKSS